MKHLIFFVLILFAGCRIEKGKSPPTTPQNGATTPPHQTQQEIKKPAFQPQYHPTSLAPMHTVQEVQNYLTWVQGFEARKQQRIKEGVKNSQQRIDEVKQSYDDAKGLGSLSDENYTNNQWKAVCKEIQTQIYAWNNLNDEYNNQSCPPFCLDFQFAYSTHLRLIINSLQQLLQSAQLSSQLFETNPNLALSQMKAQESSDKGIYDAIDQANLALDKICKTCDLPRTFDIRSE